MKFLKTAFLFLFVMAAYAVTAQLDTLATGVQDVVDVVKDIDSPLDLIMSAETIIVLVLNFIGYLAGRFGFFSFMKQWSNTTWTFILIALIVGGGFIFFGATTWIGALKAWAFSVAGYEAFFKYVFGKSEKKTV